jgi:SUKH-3 immunity protein
MNAKLLQLEPYGWRFTRTEIEAYYSLYGFILPSNVVELITEVNCLQRISFWEATNSNSEHYNFSFYRILRGYQNKIYNPIELSIGGQLFPVGEVNHTAIILVNSDLKFYYVFTGAWYCGQGINEFVEIMEEGKARHIVDKTGHRIAPDDLLI